MPGRVCDRTLVGEQSPPNTHSALHERRRQLRDRLESRGPTDVSLAQIATSAAASASIAALEVVPAPTPPSTIPPRAPLEVSNVGFIARERQLTGEPSDRFGSEAAVERSFAVGQFLPVGHSNRLLNTGHSTANGELRWSRPSAFANHFGWDRSMLETLYQTIFHDPSRWRLNSAMKLVL